MGLLCLERRQIANCQLCVCIKKRHGRSVARSPLMYSAGIVRHFCLLCSIASHSVCAEIISASVWFLLEEKLRLVRWCWRHHTFERLDHLSSSFPYLSRISWWLPPIYRVAGMFDALGHFTYLYRSHLGRPLIWIAFAAQAQCSAHFCGFIQTTEVIECWHNAVEDCEEPGHREQWQINLLALVWNWGQSVHFLPRSQTRGLR